MTRLLYCVEVRWRTIAVRQPTIPSRGDWIRVIEPEGPQMHKPIKYVEKAATIVAEAAWQVFERANRIKPNPSFTPKWSDKPLLKSWEKQKPKLGWPRETDSLCPRCIPEIRQQIIDGKL